MNRQDPRIYRLDGVEIDTSQMCLRLGDEERYLRQKTFQVLVYLLEQRHRLVTKDELIEHFWPDTAVTDNSLEQCLAEIRRILGDNSRLPNFVKTVPRAGYRFIGAVEEVWPGQSLAKDTQPTKTMNAEPVSSFSVVPSNRAPSKPARLHGWIGWQSILILATVILIAVFAFAFYSARRGSKAESLISLKLPQHEGKRPVAVMFFDNRSGIPELEWLREGLADMLITDLSRANNLTLLNREQLHMLLARAGHNEREPISLDEALQVARNSEATIVVLGSFARLGEQIRIDVQLHDSSDGQLLAAERLVVDKPMQILTQVDLLALKLASHLGAAPAGWESRTGLTSVMTDNLDAYRYYSMAVEKAQGMQNAEALGLLQKAINLDPQFAMAYARIGYTYGVTGVELEKARPYLLKGFQFSQRLTERDKLLIAAWYAIVNMDYTAAINSFRGLIAHYPLEVEAYWRLARLLNGERRYEEALEIAKQGLVIDVGAKDLYNVLGSTYSELGRHDEAIAMFRRYVELAPDEPNSHDSLALGLQWAGRYLEGVKEYERALALKRDFGIAIIHLGNAYFQQGRYREAINQYQNCIHYEFTDLDRGRGYHSLAVVFRSQGKLNEAERAARETARHNQFGVDDLFLVALARGDQAKAEKYKKVLETRSTADRGTRLSLRRLLFYRGYLDLKRGREPQAIENFRQALKHRPEIWDIDPLEDCLANAYLELGRLDEAIAECERILRLNPNYPLVHYHLAQAYARKGLSDQSQTEYQRFLQVWKAADADIPEVIAANKALSSSELAR